MLDCTQIYFHVKGNYAKKLTASIDAGKLNSVQSESMGLLDTDKMRRLREKLGISQDDAAAAAGLGSRQRWNDIESGRRANVNLETLERIASALKCKPKDLLK